MTYRIIHDGQDREAWKLARDIGVGASEVPILFGCGYGDSSELRLFAQKRGLLVKQTEVSEGMRLGHRFEPAIMDETCARAGVSPEEYRHNRALLASDDLPYCVATPDGITSSGEPIEVKNICYHIDDEDWEGGVPLKYRLQMQTQIGITVASRGLFGACLFGSRVVWDWVDRDDVLIAEINRRTKLFWRRVLDNDPPESNGTSDARNAAMRIAEKLPAVELFDGEIGDILLGIESAKSAERKASADAKRHKEARCALEDSLLLRMGSAERAVTASGVTIVKTKTTRSGYTVKPSVSEGVKILMEKKEEAA